MIKRNLVLMNTDYKYIKIKIPSDTVSHMETVEACVAGWATLFGVEVGVLTTQDLGAVPDLIEAGHISIVQAKEIIEWLT